MRFSVSLPIRIAWFLIALLCMFYAFGCVDVPEGEPVAPSISISATVDTIVEAPPPDAAERPKASPEKPQASPEKPNQAKALDVVWRQQYEMTADPPTIVWVEGDHLDCGKGRAEDGRLIGGWEANDKGRANKINHGWYEIDAAREGGGSADGFPPCVSGAFDPGAFTIQLSWPPDTVRFSTTSFSHELAHARSFLLTGAANHEGYDFAPRGRVYIADRALRREGL